MPEEKLLNSRRARGPSGVAKRFRMHMGEVLFASDASRERLSWSAGSENIPPEFRAGPARDGMAGVWLPIETARVHYLGCDRLGLTLDQQLEMGRAVGGHAQGTVLGTLVKAAKGVGVTPWTIMPHFDRLWRRAVDGGESTVVRLGPKEVRAAFLGCELLDIPYFRNGLRGSPLRERRALLDEGLHPGASQEARRPGRVPPAVGVTRGSERPTWGARVGHSRGRPSVRPRGRPEGAEVDFNQCPSGKKSSRRFVYLESSSGRRPSTRAPPTASLETLSVLAGTSIGTWRSSPPAHHDPVLRSIAGTWVPMEVCLAHYRACDALGLTIAEQASSR